MSLRAMDENRTDIVRQSIAVTQTGVNNQLSITIPENNKYLGCFITFYGDLGNVLYLDNLSLTIQ